MHWLQCFHMCVCECMHTYLCRGWATNCDLATGCQRLLVIGWMVHLYCISTSWSMWLFIWWRWNKTMYYCVCEACVIGVHTFYMVLPCTLLCINCWLELIMNCIIVCSVLPYCQLELCRDSTYSFCGNTFCCTKTTWVSCASLQLALAFHTLKLRHEFIMGQGQYVIWYCNW